MKLKYWKPTRTGIAKATIHQSGKLGFSQAAINLLKVDKNSYIKIATNAEDKKDTNLYILITKVMDDESLKVNKAGEYFYLNTKDFFNELGLDYRRKRIIYDIVEIKTGEQVIYKFIRRESDRKKKQK